MKNFLFVLSFIYCLSLSAQSSKYKIEGEISGIEDTEIILAYYFGGKQYAKDTGFRELDKDENLQKGDVLLMSILHPTLNHVALFFEGDVIHHLTDRLSCREPYSEWLLKCTGKRYRYAS